MIELGKLLNTYFFNTYFWGLVAYKPFACKKCIIWIQIQRQSMEICGRSSITVKYHITRLLQIFTNKNTILHLDSLQEVLV